MPVAGQRFSITPERGIPFYRDSRSVLSYTKARLSAGLRCPWAQEAGLEPASSEGQSVALPLELPLGRAAECRVEMAGAQDGLCGRVRVRRRHRRQSARLPECLRVRT